jgi:hypothetical protein
MKNSFSTQHRTIFQEEIAEEFGSHRPMVEREISASLRKEKITDKGLKQDEKAKKIRSKPKNTSR